jgi:hypothetical protein
MPGHRDSLACLRIYLSGPVHQYHRGPVDMIPENLWSCSSAGSVPVLSGGRVPLSTTDSW